MTWDANGNLATISGATYAHDPENRLVTATSSGTATNYTYDPQGRRIAKSSTSSTTVFLHDGANEIAE
jgi:YD repeat-containing protein